MDAPPGIELGQLNNTSKITNKKIEVITPEEKNDNNNSNSQNINNYYNNSLGSNSHYANQQQDSDEDFSIFNKNNLKDELINENSEKK